MKVNIKKDTVDLREVNHPKLAELVIRKNPGLGFLEMMRAAIIKMDEINYYKFSYRLGEEKEIILNDSED